MVVGGLHRPARPVGDGVVVAAQGGQVGAVGTAAVVVPVDVVHITPGDGLVTTREHTATIAGRHRPSSGRRRPSWPGTQPRTQSTVSGPGIGP